MQPRSSTQTVLFTDDIHKVDRSAVFGHIDLQGEEVEKVFHRLRRGFAEPVRVTCDPAETVVTDLCGIIISLERNAL